MLEFIIIFIAVWHITATIFSIYIHRSLGHNQVKFHPAVEHVFRFWLWATLAFNWPGWNRHWVCHHRKHHRYSDQTQDPHSPHHQTFKQLNNTTNELHGVTEEDFKTYTPDINPFTDRAERFYNKQKFLGFHFHIVLLFVLFGIPGACVAIIFALWCRTIATFTGKYVIHAVGFRYAQQSESDQSRIVFPISFLLGGEELHTNHHNNPTAINFAHRWFEFDIGYWYCKILSTVGLATILSRQ